ncbi:PD40 domain-containing protein [Neobacillus cucumis]|uniref:PD40 domain-containing protein n=1 Tax=Neobacillus cucumis TaxID=1740721 RepID=UPI0015E0AA60|nr:PD40 domain-containing protein [Neobacillus cucumis]
MIKNLLLSILFVIIIPTCHTAYAQNTSKELKAAFIRHHNLWTKTGDKEQQVTFEGRISYPKWSHDGNWIAYLKRTKKDGTFELWLYNSKMNNHFQVRSNVENNFQWSPRDNRISFIINKRLYVLTLDPAIPFLISEIAENIENFSWLPDGHSLLVSRKESKQLQSNLILSQITFRTNKPIVRQFYTVPVNEGEYYVSTSPFKWSYDQKWLSFLLLPTASLSADSNTLCLLSRNGQVFQRTADMLNEVEWFQWAPSKNTLGYVKGIGREANLNKQVEVVNFPSLNKELVTPNGYVDRDLSWKNNEVIYVSRAKEDTKADLINRPLPCIYQINMTSGQQKQVTFPAEQESDFAPRFIDDTLLWIRTNKYSASIFLLENQTDVKWIKIINVASNYYDRWNWDEVFSLYRGR